LTLGPPSRSRATPLSRPGSCSTTRWRRFFLWWPAAKSSHPKRLERRAWAGEAYVAVREGPGDIISKGLGVPFPYHLRRIQWGCAE
jgi:hypothetical protein